MGSLGPCSWVGGAMVKTRVIRIINCKLPRVEATIITVGAICGVVVLCPRRWSELAEAQQKWAVWAIR